MSWQILILIQTVLLSVNTLIVRALAKRKLTANASILINAVTVVTLYVVGLLFLLAEGGVMYGALEKYFWLFVLGGICFSVSYIAGYKLFTHLDAGTGGILSTVNTLFALILSALVLHETLIPLQATGSLLLMFAIVYIMFVAREHSHQIKKHRAWIWGLVYALIAAIFFAVAMVNEKYLLNYLNEETYIFYGWGVQTVAALVMAVALQRHKLKILKDAKTLRLTLLSGVLRGASGILFIKCLVLSNNLSVVSVVSNFRTIVVVLLGAWILGEKDKLRQKLLAASLAVVGMSVIFI